MLRAVTMERPLPPWSSGAVSLPLKSTSAGVSMGKGQGMVGMLELVQYEARKRLELLYGKYL